MPDSPARAPATLPSTWVLRKGRTAETVTLIVGAGVLSPGAGGSFEAALKTLAVCEDSVSPEDYVPI